MPSMPSVVTRWCPLLQLLHRNPQLREISLREDHPFGGCRQAPAMDDTATLNPQGKMGRGGISMLPSCAAPLSRSTESPAHGSGVSPGFFYLCSNKNPAIPDGAIVLLGDESLGVSPIHKATPTATVAPGTASVAPAATVAPSTSIAGIREATTSSTAVSPATSATVPPSSELQRLVQL